MLQDGRDGDALALAEHLVATNPNAPDAWHLLAISASRCGDLKRSDLAFGRALQLAPDHPVVLANHASALRQAGDYPRALATAQHAARIAPDSAQAWLEAAHAADLMGDKALAVTAINRHLVVQPESLPGWQLLASASSALNDHVTALQAARRWLQLAPGEPSAHACVALMLRKAGRAPDAVSQLRQSIARLGSKAPLLDALAGALVDASAADTAIGVAATLVRDHPGYTPGVITLARLLVEYGDDAVHGSGADRLLFQALLGKRPDDGDLRLAYATHLLAAAEGERALEQLDRLPAGSPELDLLRAQAFDACGQRAHARTLYESLQRGPLATNPTAQIRFGVHLLGSGDVAAAAGYFSAALQRDPDNQEAWAWQGTAWRLLADPREAWLCDYRNLVAALPVGVPGGVDGNTEQFLAGLQQALLPLHRANRAPPEQSLRGGSQTPGRLFGRDDPWIEGLRQTVQAAAERWLATLQPDPTHPFLRRLRRSVRFGGSWSVQLFRSGNHANHFHAEGWMSSAFYVALPAAVRDRDDDSGAIQFGQPPASCGLDLPARRIIRPQEGMLVLFPSYFWHGTVPFDQDAQRLTVAFDMTPSE